MNKDEKLYWILYAILSVALIFTTLFDSLYILIYIGFFTVLLYLRLIFEELKKK